MLRRTSLGESTYGGGHHFRTSRVGRRERCVLVVEDDEDTRFMLRTLLEKQGMIVLEAADGRAALRIAEDRHPDLILMDFSLPSVDGLAAAMRLRKHAATANTPIIFLSGWSDSASREMAFDVGGNDLRKSRAVDDLLAALRYWLEPG